MPKLGKTSKHSADKGSTTQGEGYFIPESMPLAAWHATKAKWDAILTCDGFVDIEIMSKELNGNFSPLLLNNSIEKNIKTQAGAIPDGISNYFDYCATFYEHANWQALCDTKQFQRKWRLMKEVMRLHKDGVSFNDMILALKGKRSTYMKRFDIAASPRHLRQKRSKYWFFSNLFKILETVWFWHATNIDGQLTSYDLKYMNVTGLNDAVRARVALHVAEHGEVDRS